MPFIGNQRRGLWAAFVLLAVVSHRSPIFAQQPKPAAASAPAIKAAEVEKAIRENAQQFVAAFNKSDAKSVAALWAEDGAYIDEAGERASGREAIQKKYATFFAENRDAKIELAIDAIYPVGSDAAIEDGHSKLTLSAPSGPATSGRYSVVHVRRNGKWLIASARDLPAAAAPPSDPLQDLDWLVGTWRAEHLNVEMEISCRWLADKSFVEATYSKRAGDTVSITATQIIGVDPRTGRLTSWMFNADRGYAQGVWMPRENGWAIAYEGVSAAGAITTAVNVLSRVGDALVWKSTNRTVAGVASPDIEEVVLKRK